MFFGFIWLHFLLLIIYWLLVIAVILKPPPPVNDTNPYNVFRPREKAHRLHTRRVFNSMTVLILLCKISNWQFNSCGILFVLTENLWLPFFFNRCKGGKTMHSHLKSFARWIQGRILLLFLDLSSKMKYPSTYDCLSWQFPVYWSRWSFHVIVAYHHPSPAAPEA